MLLHPSVIYVYVDEFVPVTAELEVVTGEILKAVAGNPRLHALYFTQLGHIPATAEKLTYARSFLKNIETHRQWVDNNLWWIL